jgi:uncharacterized membrane protein
VAWLNQRALLLNLLIVGAALALVIAGGAVVGTASGVGVFLIVVGVLLLQLIWLPALRLRRVGRTGGASSDSSQPGVRVVGENTERP